MGLQVDNTFANMRNSGSNSIASSNSSVNNQQNTNLLQQISPADEFLSGTKDVSKKINDGSWISKNMWAPSAIYPVIAGMLGYEGHLVHKLNKLSKGKTEQEIELIKKTLGKKFIASIGGAVLSIAALQTYFRHGRQENMNKTKDYFDSINKTNATLSDKTFYSTYKGAYYSPSTGEIHLNKNTMDDPYLRFKNKYMLKHELVHAKQYEMIARSQDGIKKINYSCIVNLIKNIKSNPDNINDFEKIYQDVANDKTGKYDNTELELDSGNVNFKNYITAIHILLNDDKASYNDIPIFINKEHYEDVIKKDGELTPEEEIKANQYYDAAINYPVLTASNMLSSNSDYKNNLLEKEAYKENPWYTRII